MIDPGLKVIKPVNDCLTIAADYENYRLRKELSGYDEDAAHELHRMMEKLEVQIKNRVYSRKDHMSVFVFLHKLKSAYDA